jgi:hypothetical protein
LGVLLIAGLVAGGLQLGRVIVARSVATHAFLEQVHAEGFPPANNAIWLDKTAGDPDVIDKSNLYLKSRGEAEKVERPKCRFRKRTDGQGYRSNQVICFTGVQYKETRSSHAVIWKWTGEDWKIAHFYFEFRKEKPAQPPA